MLSSGPGSLDVDDRDAQPPGREDSQIELSRCLIRSSNVNVEDDLYKLVIKVCLILQINILMLSSTFMKPTVSFIPMAPVSVFIECQALRHPYKEVVYL